MGRPPVPPSVLVSPADLVEDARKIARLSGAAGVELSHLTKALSSAVAKAQGVAGTWPDDLPAWLEPMHLDKRAAQIPAFWGKSSESPGAEPVVSSSVASFAQWKPAKRRALVEADKVLRKIVALARRDGNKQMGDLLALVWNEDLGEVRGALDAFAAAAVSVSLGLQRRWRRSELQVEEVPGEIYWQFADRLLCRPIAELASKPRSFILQTVVNVLLDAFRRRRVRRRIFEAWPEDTESRLDFSCSPPESPGLPCDAPDAVLEAVLPRLGAHRQAYFEALRTQRGRIRDLHDACGHCRLNAYRCKKLLLQKLVAEIATMQKERAK